jgi:deoxyribodipyrimidine photo-lyase
MVRDPDLISKTAKLPIFSSEARHFRESEEDISSTYLIDLNDDRSVEGKSAIPFHGGETSALERVDHYFSSRAVESYKTTRNGLVGTDYSTKFSAFLAHGNISARHIYYLLKQHEEKFMKGRASKETYWVVFELLWRDFWKFLVRKTKNQVFYLEGRNHGSLHGENSNKWSTNSELFQHSLAF